MFYPSVHESINRYPLTITPETLVEEVIALMSEQRTRFTLVVEYLSEESQRQLVGVFTERDVVKITASGIELKNVAIADVMTRNIITLRESELEDVFAVLARMRQHKIRHLPIVDDAGQLVGIVTPQSIREALKPRDLLRVRRVGEVMSNNVIHAPLSASVLELRKNYPFCRDRTRYHRA